MRNEYYISVGKWTDFYYLFFLLKDGSVSEAGSESSSLHDASRKRSVMEQDIANTIKKVTHVQTADELLTPTNTVGTVPIGLPEPLTPTPAVYVAPEPVTSPKINELKKTFSDENKTFKVEKIDIPKSANKVETRYLDNVNKVEKSEKKMSFISNEDRQKDLELKKAMFEKPKLSAKPSLEFQKPNEKTASVITTSVKENNNNQVINNSKVATSNERPSYQRVESQQTGNKFVTVLSVGGGPDKKSPLNKAISFPNQSTSANPQIVAQRSKTLSVKKSKPFEEKPQSSIPPESPLTQTESQYSMAGNSQFYSSLSNYSSALPEGTEVFPIKNQVPDNKASDTSAYSYADPNYDPYSSVNEDPGEVIHSKPKVEASNVQSTQVYSYATDPMNSADNIYSAINKPKKNNAGKDYDAVYEAVSVGSPSDKVILYFLTTKEILCKSL